MKRSVLFGLMSSQQSDTTVSQLVDALGGRPVVVHHDFTKRAAFRLAQPNVDFVPAPKVTGWGTWGFVEAIAHLMEHALREHEFDYLQLLSPTCLPLRPIEEFEAHVSTTSAEVNADLLPIDDDTDATVHFGYRSFVPRGSMRYRVLRRSRRWYFGSDATLEQTRSLSLLRRPAGASPTVGSLTALALHRVAAAGGMGPVPYGPGFRPAMGSTWFGARRSVCEYLLARIKMRDVSRFFSRLDLCDESLLGNLISNSGFRIGPSNHAISPFDMNGHPIWIGEAELDVMLSLIHI